MAIRSIFTHTIFEHPLALLRIWLGIAFIMHGLPGIFNSDYMAGHAGMLEMYGIPLHNVLAYVSKGGELLAGLLLVLGLFTRFGTILIMVIMLVATFSALRGDIFGDYQAEISFTYFLIALVIFLYGPTHFSLDNLVMKRKDP